MSQQSAPQITAKSAYLTNDLYGGYSYDELWNWGVSRKTSCAVDYANPEDVIKFTRKHGLKIHLASGSWKAVGKEGWGEVVSVEEAERLVKELKVKFGRVKA